LEEPFLADVIPPRYETPFEVSFECTSMYSKVAYPGCTYFDYCWPEYAGQGRLTIPEEKRK
jgi:hypothetical protein